MFATDLKIPWDYPLASKEQFDALPRPDKTVRSTWHLPDLPPSDLNPHLLQWFKERGIHIPYYDIFIQPPQYVMHIHIDQHDVFDNATKMNFSYCSGTGFNKMCWFDAKEEDSQIRGNAGGLYRNWLPDYTTMVYDHEIATPSLVNVGKPHNVVNMTNEARICISIVMVKQSEVPDHIDDNTVVPYLQWGEAVEIFKDCICQDTTSI